MLITFHAVDTEPVPNNISGLTVSVYDSADTFVVRGTTDVNGLLEIDLLVGNYTARFRSYIYNGYSVESPQKFTVLEDAVYRVPVERFWQPVSTDPALCRMSGYLKDYYGRPFSKKKFIIWSQHDQIVIGDSLVDDSKLVFETDENGYYEFDLVRGLSYRFKSISIFNTLDTDDWIDHHRELVVPDVPKASLHGIIHPFPGAISFDTLTLALNVGDPATAFTGSVLWSNGDETAIDSITYESTDESVLTVSGAEITPVAAGTADIIARYSTVYHKEFVLSGKIAVTVT